MRSESPGWDTFSEARFVPPSRVAATARERLNERLDEAVAAGRTAFVVAPSGFGKTTAVSSWAAGLGQPVGWLSLTRYDADPHRLLSGIVGALRRAAIVADGAELRALATLDAGARDASASYAAIVDALAEVVRPVVLVVDDVHRAGAAARGSILWNLVEQPPTGLRLVLIGREPRQLPVDRLLVTDAASMIGVDDLRFDAHEAAQVAAAAGRTLETGEADRLVAATGGWPVAVRLVLAAAGESADAEIEAPDRASIDPAGLGLELGAGSPGSRAVLADFVADEILAALPDDLADFVLAATTTSDVDAPLAAELSGRTDAVVLLEECVARGLFLDRFGTGAGAGYRWHTVFASTCRHLVERRDPERAAALHRAAGRFLASTHPLLAFDESLAAGDVPTAVETLRANWVRLLVGPNGDALTLACSRLPSRWQTLAEIRLIRAAATGLAGGRAQGQALYADAADEVDGDPEASVTAKRTRWMAALFLEDDRAALAAAVDVVERDLATLESAEPGWLAACLLLLGITQMSLRWEASATTRTFEAAESHALAARDPFIAKRAAGALTFARAFRGDFVEARAVLERTGTPSGSDAWFDYIGNSEHFATAWIAYWCDDLDTARAHFRRVLDGGSGATSFDGFARQYLAYVAAIDGDAADRAEAAALLRGMPEIERHGIPWPAYRLAATAKLAEAEGRFDRAAAIVRRFEHVEQIPATTVVLAELARRHVGEQVALRMLEQITETGRASFARASALVTLALIRRAHGDRAGAHERLERALQVAVPQGIARPFADEWTDVRQLMLEHVTWGSEHGGFLAHVIARRDDRKGLTERERDVLGYLRTSMTTAEIATELGLSVNTVKTHLRIIYRKLGVSDRRSAASTII